MVLEIVTPVTWTDAGETEAGTGEDAGAGHPVPSGGGGLAPGASHPGGIGDTEEEEDLEDINTRAHMKTYPGLLVMLPNLSWRSPDINLLLMTLLNNFILIIVQRQHELNCVHV